jgi:hypothetical protein
MKKIFLLSLLSVLLLSAFSQISTGSTEVITQVNISTADEDGGSETNAPLGWWLFFWRNVKTTPLPGGGIMVTCTGLGWRMCIASYHELGELFNYCSTRGIDSRLVEQTYSSLYDESGERVANGEFSGSISKKIAVGNNTLMLFQMKWIADPKNSRNCNAEIIISKTNTLGF